MEDRGLLINSRQGKKYPLRQSDKFWCTSSLLFNRQGGGVFPPRVEQMGCESGHILLPSEHVKNAWNYTSSPPVVHLLLGTVKIH
jgi:hypothetical protein